MFCCCRILHFIKRYVLSAWYPKEPVVYQRLEGKLTIIKSVSLDRTITKYKIWDKDIQPKYLDPTEVTYILKSKVEAPWLWFGAESPVGRTDLTNCFEESLEYFSIDNDCRWELIAVGVNASRADQEPTFLQIPVV